MSVLVEAITVIFRNATADTLIKGGVDAIRCNPPNGTYRTDGILSAVGFMTPQDSKQFVNVLKRLGFKFVENGTSVDIALCDQYRGFSSVCDWLGTDIDERGVRYCWLLGSDLGDIAVQEGWDFEKSLYNAGSFTENEEPIDHLEFLRTEGGCNIYLDKNTDKEVWIGRPFEDTDDIHTKRLKELLFASVIKTVNDAMIAEGWMSINVNWEIDAFPHLVMRYQNQIGIVFVEVTWNEVAVSQLNDANEDRLTDKTETMKAIPLVASFDIVGNPDKPITKVAEVEACKSIRFNLRRPYVLHNLSTRDEWSASDYDLEAEVELSDWEVHDFGIQVVRQALEKDGHRIEDWDSEFGATPQIIATIDQKFTYIVTRTVCYPALETKIEAEVLRRTAELAARNGAVLKIASVFLASVEDPFDPSNNNVQPIYRGAAVYPRFTGLMDPVITTDG